MTSLRRLALAFLPFTLAATAHCGGGPSPVIAQADASADDGGAKDAGPDEDPPLVPASKVDVLFVVDNSHSMAEKQSLVARSVGTLLRRFVEPSCVDANDPSKVVGQSAGGTCAAGVLEHAPLEDIHVGVISTSLGSLPTPHPEDKVCDDEANPRLNDRAHLLTKGKDGAVIASAASGFLHYAKGGAAGTIADLATLQADAAKIIVGVDQTGCGFEAQLESVYRFLVEPDPPAKLVVDATGRAQYEGNDDALLAQRKAFLRPDSAVAVVMVTDEDDSAVDPRSVRGQGWSYASKNFVGSKVFRGDTKQGTTAPRATTICATNPASPDCASCGYARLCKPEDPACQKLKADPNCQVLGAQPRPGDSTDGFIGYYGPTEDNLNVRFHRMKQRYGVDPQFPIARYVRGLTDRRVPKRTTDHDESGAYVDAPTCRNPLFAASLPSSGSEELCDRDDGPRSRRLVFFGLIGGVPKELLKPKLEAADWTKILGQDPAAYDASGIDPHMRQSTAARAGLAPPSSVRGDNGTDPIHGREWDTKRDDLQYACTFDLPETMTCPDDWSCDCAVDKNPPLCGAAKGAQVKGKAYPTIRELRVAQGLGDRAVVASICALDGQKGYGAVFDALADRMGGALVK